MKLTSSQKRIAAFALVLIFLICSVTVFAKTFTNPETYRGTIQSIDDKKVTVLGVSASIAATATLLASVPDDATTPLAQELMDLSSYLLIVICVLVLEKSLLTVFGAVACYILFPAACILAMVFIVNNKKVLMAWATKIAILGLAFLLVVPASMKLSDYIYEVNQISFQQKIDEDLEADETQAETEEYLPWYKKLWDSVANAVKETAESAVEKGKEALNKCIDAVSAFVIAYCAIPILVIFLFLWLAKVLFGLKTSAKLDFLAPKGIKNLTSERKELEALKE